MLVVGATSRLLKRGDGDRLGVRSWPIVPGEWKRSDHSTKQQEDSERQTSVANTTTTRLPTNLLPALRILLLDAPFTFLLVLYAITLLLHQCNDLYVRPQIFELLQWNRRPDRQRDEVTYYSRMCTEADQTAFEPEEILATPGVHSTDDVVDLMLKHGVTVFPDILSPETALELRDFVLEHNGKGDDFYVLKGENRHSLGLKMEEPVVRKAMQEISTHPVLQPALKQIVGENAAVYKLHSITSKFGSEAQSVHTDVITGSSALMYARSFGHIYSLFIPLQNTTVEMGGTEFCPGTHICRNGKGFCQRTGFSAIDPATNQLPVGYGALMNQQLTHRGPAHNDPRPNSDRVVLTLSFTQRPRYGNTLGSKHISHLETRALALGGTYAVHWSQWGWTTQGFRDARQFVSSLGSFLRTFGLGIAWNNVWGWDYLTVLSTQLANDSHHFPKQQAIESFIGRATWGLLPASVWSKLQGRHAVARYNFIADTIANCKDYLQIICLAALVLYVSLILGCSGWKLLANNRRPNNTFSSVLSSLSRLVLIQTIVWIVVYYAPMWHIAKTPWARHIRGRKLFQLSKTFRGPVLPAVLPVEGDVLSLDDYQSPYMASYTRILEVAHPGNAAWKQLVDENARGYGQLPHPLQQQLRSSLLVWNQQMQSRLLTKNHQNQWAELPQKMAEGFVHKHLMRRHNVFVDAAVRQLDYLSAESRFGVWRDTALHQTAVPALLRSLEERILASSESSTASSALLRNSGGHFDTPKSFLAPPLFRSSSETGWTKRSGIPRSRHRDVQEPFPGAWVKVGDEVEARYSYDNESNIWFRGKVIGANAHELSWDVEYYDLEVDKSLCRRCVKPFEEYQAGHMVRFFTEEDEVWHDAVIRSVHGNDTYTFERTGDEPAIIVKQTQDIHRYRRDQELSSEVAYKLGDQVETKGTLWKGSQSAWELGTIISLEDDDVYGVAHHDGDRFRLNVRHSRIRHITAQMEANQ